MKEARHYLIRSAEINDPNLDSQYLKELDYPDLLKELSILFKHPSEELRNPIKV